MTKKTQLSENFADTTNSASRVSNYFIRFALLTLILLLSACQPAEVPAEEDIDGITDFSPQTIPDFTLTDQSGTPVQLSDYQGKLVLLYFGFTHCPDFCPATLNDFKLIKQALGEAADDVVFLFISVDPERDTPKALTRYIQRFDPSFIAASSTDEQVLRDLTAAFSTTYEIPDHAAGESYSVGHSSSKFLLNREGKLTAKYSFGIPFDMVAEDLRGKLG